MKGRSRGITQKERGSSEGRGTFLPQTRETKSRGPCGLGSRNAGREQDYSGRDPIAKVGAGHNNTKASNRQAGDCSERVPRPTSQLEEPGGEHETPNVEWICVVLQRKNGRGGETGNEGNQGAVEQGTTRPLRDEDDRLSGITHKAQWSGENHHTGRDEMNKQITVENKGKEGGKNQPLKGE